MQGSDITAKTTDQLVLVKNQSQEYEESQQVQDSLYRLK